MTIQDVLKEFDAGFWATGGEDVDGIADEWASAGFTAETTRQWLAAGCYSPGSAKHLVSRGWTPETAEREMIQLVCNCDLWPAPEAR
jgi:hypothetical protein